LPGDGQFTVVDLGLGRVALRHAEGYLSAEGSGAVSLRRGEPGNAESFQWMESFDGDLLLMSLSTNRFLRVDPSTGRTIADSAGPRPDGSDGVRFRWEVRP
jgi:hypothetical protein